MRVIEQLWTCRIQSKVFICFFIFENSLETNALEIPGIDDVKSQTKGLLNSVLMAGKLLDSLPKRMMLTMKLQYYDGMYTTMFTFYTVNVFILDFVLETPSDYLPNGFKVDDFPNVEFVSGPVNVKVGAVNTVGG